MTPDAAAQADLIYIRADTVPLHPGDRVRSGSPYGALGTVVSVRGNRPDSLVIVRWDFLLNGVPGTEQSGEPRALLYIQS